MRSENLQFPLEIIGIFINNHSVSPLGSGGGGGVFGKFCPRRGDNIFSRQEGTYIFADGDFVWFLVVFGRDDVCMYVVFWMFLLPSL